MATRRPQGGLLQGPIAFWSLVFLLLLAVYGGFRALAPQRPGAGRSATSATAPQPGEKAAAGTSLWGGKPLQLPKPGAPGAVPKPVVAAVPAAAPKGVGLTPEEVAARIQQAHPALVVFFSTDSSASQEMFPQLVKLTQPVETPEVLAFATDQDASAVDTFLRINRASFDAALLQPAKPGELATALAEAGLKVGKQLVTPFVAVVGSDGKVLGQWPGITDLGPVAAILHPQKPPKPAKAEPTDEPEDGAE